MFKFVSKRAVQPRMINIFLLAMSPPHRVLWFDEPADCLFYFQPSASQTANKSSKKSTTDQKDPDQPCFTKKEVRDILFERNELKTNLFLVQEELNYYQRWV